MMRTCKNMRVLKLCVVCCVLWTSVIIYLYSNLGQSLEVFWDEVTGSTNTKIWLKQLMHHTQDHHIKTNVLSSLLHPNSKHLHYFHLPKRIFDTTFTEITSANRDSSYPLAPDFTFHIEYLEKSVVLYDDYGPGCIYRYVNTKDVIIKLS